MLARPGLTLRSKILIGPLITGSLRDDAHSSISFGSLVARQRAVESQLGGLPLSTDYNYCIKLVFSIGITFILVGTAGRGYNLDSEHQRRNLQNCGWSETIYRNRSLSRSICRFGGAFGGSPTRIRAWTSVDFRAR